MFKGVDCLVGEGGAGFFETVEAGLEVDEGEGEAEGGWEAL